MNLDNKNIGNVTSLKGEKILITGGLGFIGSNLAHSCLELGAKVTIYDCLNPNSGGNLSDVLKGVGLDSRIGSHYFRPSPAWGGSCFPKDVVEVNNFYESNELNLPLISNIIESNKIQTSWTTKMIKNIIDQKNLNGAILVGAAFKEDTDDLRNSPTLDIEKELIKSGVNVRIYDELIYSEEFINLNDFEEIDSPHLIALMYPINESLLAKINNIVNESNSFLYIPWEL